MLRAATTLAALSVALLGFASSAQATIFEFNVVLNGANDNNPLVTGTGSAHIVLDPTLQTLSLHIEFTGLSGNPTGAHIHCCQTVPGVGNAGVATPTPVFPGFPTIGTSGTYDGVLNLSLATSYNPAFVTAQGGLANAEAAFISGLEHNRTYLNIHTAAFPGGEIRGALATPEPSTLAMFGFGLLGLGFMMRKRVLAA